MSYDCNFTIIFIIIYIVSQWRSPVPRPGIIFYQTVRFWAKFYRLIDLSTINISEYNLLTNQQMFKNALHCSVYENDEWLLAPPANKQRDTG